MHDSDSWGRAVEARILEYFQLVIDAQDVAIELIDHDLQRCWTNFHVVYREFGSSRIARACLRVTDKELEALTGKTCAESLRLLHKSHVPPPSRKCRCELRDLLVHGCVSAHGQKCPSTAY